MTPKAQKVMNSLKRGKQPAKNTAKWVIESLEQGLIIELDYSTYKYRIIK